MAKTKADLHREWARVLDMCEGTGVDPNFCCKYEGVNLNRTPLFDSDPDRYEFIVGIVEGKPVFVGDKLYDIDDNGSYFTVDRTTVRFNGLTWNPPKHTFELNGVELPCPISEGHWYLQITGGSYVEYRFKTEEHRDTVMRSFTELLSKAKI